MANVMPPQDWCEYFASLQTLLDSTRRQFGLANETYTEYAIERLTLSCRGLASIRDAVRQADRDDSLNAVDALLAGLLRNMHALLQYWQLYQGTLDANTARYCVPTDRQPRQRGRPRFDISQEQLEYLRSLSFSWTEIASLLGVSRMTVYRRRREYGMPAATQDQQIGDDDLREIVLQLRTELPQVGESLIIGRLRSLGYQLPRRRVRQAIRESDPLNTALHWQGVAAVRRLYSVPGPNSLWHIGI